MLPFLLVQSANTEFILKKGTSILHRLCFIDVYKIELLRNTYKIYIFEKTLRTKNV